MRSDGDRDAITLDIVTSLLIFAGLGAVPLVLVDVLVADGTLRDALGYVVLGCASVAAIGYLWRNRAS